MLESSISVSIQLQLNYILEETVDVYTCRYLSTAAEVSPLLEVLMCEGVSQITWVLYNYSGHFIFSTLLKQTKNNAQETISIRLGPQCPTFL